VLRSHRTPISIPVALLITAAAGLASVPPISIAGLGVVEGLIAGVALALGGGYAAALLAALLLRGLALAVSALCRLLCLIERDEISRSDVAPNEAEVWVRERE
jgi:uncharacterized membrane protein YbhN (UPF0104 family)